MKFDALLDLELFFKKMVANCMAEILKTGGRYVHVHRDGEPENLTKFDKFSEICQIVWFAIPVNLDIATT